MATCPPSLSHHHFAISFLILLISTTSHVRLFNAQGRMVQSSNKAIWRAQIGSKPPRCERRCGSSCGHCEAIQVPANPQMRAAASRDADSSNYKPMSWKCKCGNLVFNP